MLERSVVIIGGGPAGSAAGYYLARAGFKVTIVESREFPRVKVCGEYISPAVREELEKIVPRAELEGAGAARIDQFVIEVGKKRHVWEMPCSAWSLSRGSLDNLLLNKARQAGARVLQPATVMRVEYSDQLVEVRLGDGDCLRAALVIHADGSGRHDPAGPTPHAPRLIGHKCHMRVPSGLIQGVTIRSCEGGYLGLINVEQGLATCALVATSRLTGRHGGDTDALVRDMWPAYRGEWRASEWKACGVARGRYRPPGHARSLRVGNAAAAVDPIGGEGVGLALWSGGHLASSLLSSSGHERRLTADVCREVERLLRRAYRRRLRGRLPACRAAAEVLSRPWLVRLLWPMLLAPSLTVKPWYAMTGKPVRAALGAG